MSLPPSPQATLYVMSRDRAAILPFWRDTLGLTVTEDAPHAVTLAGAGVDLQIVTASDATASPHPILSWTVPDIVATSTALAARGVVFHSYPGMTEGPLGLCTLPDGSRMNWFSDPEGHVLMLVQPA